MNFATLNSPFYLGTLNVLSTQTIARTIGAGPTTNAGIVQFNGTGANSLILSNASSHLLTLALRATGIGSEGMSLRVDAASSTINTSGTGGITISASIAETGTGKGITKVGAGVLTLSGNNTYSGTTTIQAGELRVTGTSGSNTGTGNVTVQSGATLSGNGRVLPGEGNIVSVLNGGSIRADGGNGTGTGTLTIGNTVVQSGGILRANLAASGTSSTLAFAGNTLDLKTGSVLRLDDVTGFNAGTYNLATFTNGNSLLLDATATTDGQLLGEYVQGTGASGPVTIDVTALPTLASGDRLELRRTGNNMVLTFSPVPEPGAILAVCGLVGGGIAAVRRVKRKPA